MGSLLAAIGMILLVIGIVALAALGLIMWRFTISNRIERHTPTKAPITWLYSPAALPRMHRRLRSAVLLVQASEPTASREPLIDTLVEHAAGIDDELVLVSHLRGAERAAQRRRLEGRTAFLEAQAVRVAGLTTLAEPQMSGDLRELGELVDHAEDAEAEVERLDPHFGRREIADRGDQVG